MMRILPSLPVLFALASVGAAPPQLAAQEAEEKAGLDIPQGYILPDAAVQDLFATDPNYATLDHVSPDGDHFVVPLSTELSTLAEVGEETLRLGMLEIRARADRPWHLDIYGLYGFRFYSLSGRAYTDVDLPDGIYVSDFMWSPDGSRLAFLAHLEERTEVWIADTSDGSVTPAGDARVIATIGTSSRGQGSAPSRMLQWTPAGSVLTLAAPANRGSPPPAPALPSGPTIRHTRADATPTRTMPFLLEDEHGADLFEYYTRSQIVELAPGRPPRTIGEPGMYESLSSSPDGRHVIATRLTRPFSYIASYTGFPRVTEVIEVESGDVLATLEERELRESARGGGPGGGPRDWMWRPDGSGISYLQRAEAEAGEDEAEEGEDDRPDRIMLLRAPFGDSDAEVVATSDDRISGVTYSADGRHAFADVRRDGDAALVHYALGSGDPEGHALVPLHDPGDAVELPGDLLTARTGNGIEYAWMSSGGTSAYLRGDGWKEDFRPQPFVDRLSIPDGTTERVFEGSRDSFDQPLVPLDADMARLVVSREGKNTFPDSYLWTRGGGMENLTRNVDPFPQLTAARRIDFEFTRRDGLEIQGRVSLPVDYVEGTRVPAVFWTYPREYRSEDDFDNATVRARNHNAYTNLTWLRWSDIWLTQGYAIVYPDIPIVGENYNDYYISNMVDGMYAAIRTVDALGVVDMDRIGHGGHSYGAFATANFLAHTPFFKAGIAGDGAYNRSLTPMGFQAEPRDIWEAPHVYMEMSPFFKADQINTPLLLYHGADDNNSGTYPIQSRRMIQALTGLGKTAALFEYPFESHTPRAIENNLDMWARWIDWFDRYVKGVGEDGARTTTDSP
ncbi:MAG: prolyl oligopeptidase family serine peptidase [Gemmatimonadales bacterium]|nr:prolyl oligopeptidase family serine peptidase [Gemmatimonadales bacterium]